MTESFADDWRYNIYNLFCVKYKTDWANNTQYVVQYSILDEWIDEKMHGYNPSQIFAKILFEVDS